ncbi:MAG: sigma-70 family RNA polymerase sigma factor [Leptolinea sp.]
MANPARRRKKSQVLGMLLEKADIQGYLTTEDLMEAYPEVSADAERLEAVMTALRHRGVEFLDGEADNSDGGDYLSDSDFDPYQSDLAPLSSQDTIGLYLKEMARVPLLKIKEELNLAQRIEAGLSAGKKLQAFSDSGTPELREEMELTVEDGLQARDHLIKANTRLVVSIAKRYLSRGVPFLDLIQEGNLGLMKAVEKFEYQRGFRFSTYATWWIRQTISRSIADQGRTIRVPVHMVDRIRQLYKLTHELEQKLGRDPTTIELGEQMGVSSDKVDWMLQVSWLPLSLESPISEEDDSELGMFVEDEITPTPMQSAYTNLLREKIEEVLATLPPREARILRLRFGLDNGRTYTLEEVGKKFGLTRERIRQIEGKALSRLRHPRRARQLKDYSS